MSSFHALLGRQSGTATISRSQVEFVSDDLQQKLIIPLGSLQISVEGRNSVHFYLSNKAYPGKEICLQDPTAIDLLSSFGFEQASAVSKKALQTKTFKAVAWSSPVVMGFAALFLIPLIMSFIPVAWINQLVTVQQEKDLGDLIWPKIFAKEGIQDEAKEKIALEKMLKALIEANPDLEKFKIEIHVSSDSEVNAFALPGGRIIINKGLMQKSTPSEILGVMAHELAHIERRHILKSLSGSVGTLFGYVTLYSIAGPDAADVLMRVTSFTSLTYSRADEAEADRRGLEFIQNAGFSGEGMVTFFEKLAAESSTLEKSLAILSTHPASDDRAATLKELIRLKKANKELPVKPGDFAP